MGRRLIVEADGGSRGNPGPAGYGAVVRDADTGEVLAEVAAGIGVASNNVAEYRGLLAGLAAAAAIPDIEAVEVRMDSKLVVEQMAGRWQVKHPDMRALRRSAAEVVARLPSVRYTHVRRELNAYADRLANEAMDAAARGDTWLRRTPVTAVAEVAGPVEPVEAAEPVEAGRPEGWFVPPSAPTSLVLVRHGQTALSVDRRFCGSSDPELTARGRAEAAAASDRFASRRRPDAVWTSPTRRTRATADAVGRRLGLEPRLDDRLRETDFGVWEGLTFAEVRERWPDELAAWLADVTVAPPGGESLAATARRVRQARDAILAAHPGQTVVVVSHVTPIKSLLRQALNAPPVALYRLHLDPASLSQIDWYDDGTAIVRRVNDTCHLET